MTENRNTGNNNTSLFASSMHRNPQHQHSDSNLDDESSCATSSYVGNSSAYASTAGDYCSTVDGGAGDDYDHSDTTGYGTSTGDATSTGQSGYDDDNVSEYNDGASNTVGGMLSGSSSSPRGGMYDESQLMSSVRTRGGNSGGGGSGGHGGPGAGTPKEELDKVHHYAAKDTRNVRAWRLVVLTMLLITGAMVSTGAYKFLGREQNNDFTTSYYLYANTIHDASQFRMRNMLTSIKGLAETVSATVETSTLTENSGGQNNEFPMMTIPMFQVQGRHVREQLSAPWIAYSPIVADSVRLRWENYSFEHAHAWMMMGSDEQAAVVVQQQNAEAHQKQKLSHRDRRRALLLLPRRHLQQLNDTNNVSPVIQIGIENGAYVPAPTQSFYAPIWQMDPVPTSLRAMQKINLDTLVEERNVRLLHVVEQVREAVFSEVINVADSIWNGMTTSTTTTTTTTEEEEEPQSILIQPIYATLDRDVQSIITGTIYAQIPWTNFMVHLLPAEVRGIYALLENSCGQVYTYLLNGATNANADAATSSTSNNATTATTTDDSVVVSDGWPLYLGPGDARAERDRIAAFDDMQVRVPLHPYVHPALTPNASGHCSYELRLYPSQTLQQTTTSTAVPTWSAVTVGMIFLLMASAFLIYDRFVQRRNSKVVDAAARSNAIVSSLFPSNIRDRLFAASTTSKGNGGGDGDGGAAANGSSHFQTNGIKTSSTSNGSSSSKLPQALQKAMNNVSYDSTTPKYRLKNFLNKNGSSEFNAKEAEQEQKQQQGGGDEQSGENGNASPAAAKKASSSSGSGKKNNRRSVYGHGALGGALSHSDDDDEDVFFQGKPIADLFPETTIIFADIAGFTAWSSVREPSQVFTLLETIYRAFDEIARKRRVFKVETVGDCYVAVTGLPDPDKGHAVAMARFARDCMIRMNSLTKKLEVTLGPDTGDLCMRMGLHSGPVTAGVLRGERSRFQLFGDTMNTASRMESTGMKGRIQVSQETADLLIAAAKAEWVVPREETVVAKGKGEMQTYWLVMNLSDSHHSGASVSGDSIVSVPGADGQQRRKRKKPKQPHQKQQSHDPQEQKNQGENDDANPEEEEEEPSNADSRPEVEIKEMDYGDKVEFHPDEHTPEDSAKATSNTNAVKLYELTAAKQARLIDWNVDVMLRLLKQIVARRNAIAKFAPLDVIPGANIAANVAGHALSGAGQALSYVPGAGLAGQAISTVANVPIGLAGQTIGLAGQALSTTGHVANQVLSTTAEAVPIPIPGLGPRKVQRRPSLAMANFTVLEEVSEIITLPKFNAKAAKHQEDPDNVQLRDAVVEQLHDYITNIANMYHGNPFHNFEHASHVTMSVAKLLSRIVAPAEVLEPQEDETGKDNKKKGKKAMATAMHDHTYGITSDPLTQFACVFSALIHDCDHPGVPNAQLCKENSRLALAYKKKSVAEQNSVDLAWELLVDNHYTDLRNTIFATDSEARRFRQLVVNSVMATDIVDKDLKNLRNARWEKAFSESAPADQQESRVDINRKATIVIEHLIQASDVAHTMQHWHIYRKWNERFYMECYLAYKNGRADKDPAEGWYKGELGFYDFYIIPLAKKLKDCGVFGVSSDEYLNYAVRNREEWEIRGHEIVEEMVELAHSKIGKPGNDENGDAPPSPSRRSQRHLLEVVSD